MHDENLSTEQSLQVIYQMIEKAKNQFSENGHLYLLWGWLVFICSIAQFILMKFVKYEQHYIVWLLTWGAFIYQVVYLRKKNRQRRAKSYADTITAYIWISFFILLMLTGFAMGKTGETNYYKLYAPVFLAIYGVPTFLSGVFLRFRPLVSGGIGCWLLSILAHFIPYDFQLLLLSAAMIIAWVIPGYALQKRYKIQNT
jgi:FtsH-binding integral membrane protein